MCDFARRCRTFSCKGKGFMKASTIAKTVCAVSLSALCVVGITACSSTSGSKGVGGVAATVNGAEIQEEEVTASVESIRSQMSLTDEDAWGEWMVKYDYTPEKVREEVIDSLVTKQLIIQGAEEKGVTVSDDKWNEALQAVGMTEDEYKSNIKTSLLQQGLMKTFEGDDPSDEDVLSYAQTYISSFDGAKRSSHILFDADDTETAQSVLDQINAGTLDFAEAAKTYSKDGSAQNGGDVGWDKLNSFVSEYTAGLADLSKGQVSGLVTSSYGIHIIKCTDEFHAPDELTSLDQLPSEFVEQFRSSLKSSNQSKAYQQWLSDAKDNADIEIKDMPSGLPYDLDMSKYQSDDSSDSSSTDGGGSSVDNEVSATDASSTSSDTASDSGDSETKKAA